MKLLAHPRSRRRVLTVSNLKRLSLVTWLRIIWIGAVLWYEVGAFWWSAARCGWPDRGLLLNEHHSKPKHVLLVADPQILDHRSYPGRAGWLMMLSQFIVDLNLRKSWTAVASRFQPDMTVFLGDMMDNGRLASTDAEYSSYYERFQSIFTPKDPRSSVYYIPGNHDVGLGFSNLFHPQRRQRYQTHFGPLNQRVGVANHTLALLDAPGLVEEDYMRASSGLEFEYWTPPAHGAVEFIRTFSSDRPEGSVILFSHIPLFRSDRASCGPLRERGTIRRGAGFGYQLTLGRVTTEYLLRTVRPSLVFSADDHDYCEYTHRVPLSNDESADGEREALEVKEITVKSFSMAMGIKQPGFQLLSLAPLDSDRSTQQSHTIADAPCLLPNQLAIYLERYLPLFLISLIALGISSFRQVAHQHISRSLSLPLANGHSFSLGKGSRRRESAVWVALSPDHEHEHFDLPSPQDTHGEFMEATAMNSRTLRVPSGSTFRSAAGNGSPSTPSFRAYSPSAVQLDMPMPLSGLGISGISGASPSSVHAPRTHMSEEQDHAGDGVYTDGDGNDDAIFGTMGPDNRIKRSVWASPVTADEEAYIAQTSTKRSNPRDRRWRWSWSFPFRNRWRSLSIGVPPPIEALIRRMFGCSMAAKNVKSEEAMIVVFFHDLIAAAWIPVGVFATVVIFMFR